VERLGLQNASTAEVVVFALLAGATIVFALLTVTRRNPVTAVMSLVATFFSLAGLYATLSAHFLAVLQVLVYAGAIMVLFIFVVMILNREEVEPISFRGIFTRGLGVVAVGWGTWTALALVRFTSDTVLLKGPTTPLPEDYGTVAATGMSLFRDFVYPFEAISLLLLVAIVGGVMVSRSHRQEEESEAVAEQHRRVQAAISPEQRLAPAGDVQGKHDQHDQHDQHGARTARAGHG
jgi:NADH-quinone oxidoreductase subunit J